MIFHDEEGVHMSEADYAELVERREIGPCGKHLKMFWAEGHIHVNGKEATYLQVCCSVCPPNASEQPHLHYCRICREIKQAVEHQLSRHHCDYCKQDMSGQEYDGHYTIFCHKPNCVEQATGQEVARTYEAAAQHVPILMTDRDGELYEASCACGVKFDTSFSRESKWAFAWMEEWQKHIRSLDSSAARLAKQRIRESALREAAAEIHPEDFDEGSSENCALLAVQHIIIQLIDKPGGK